MRARIVGGGARHRSRGRASERVDRGIDRRGPGRGDRGGVVATSTLSAPQIAKTPSRRPPSRRWCPPRLRRPTPTPSPTTVVPAIAFGGDCRAVIDDRRGIGDHRDADGPLERGVSAGRRRPGRGEVPVDRRGRGVPGRGRLGLPLGRGSGDRQITGRHRAGLHHRRVLVPVRRALRRCGGHGLGIEQRPAGGAHGRRGGTGGSLPGYGAVASGRGLGRAGVRRHPRRDRPGARAGRHRRPSGRLLPPRVRLGGAPRTRCGRLLRRGQPLRTRGHDHGGRRDVRPGSSPDLDAISRYGGIRTDVAGADAAWYLPDFTSTASLLVVQSGRTP